MYINGTEVNPVYIDNTNLPLFLGTSDIYIGAVNNGSEAFLDGCVDEIRIYSRALAQDEIIEKYYEFA